MLDDHRLSSAKFNNKLILKKTVRFSTNYCFNSNGWWLMASMVNFRFRGLSRKKFSLLHMTSLVICLALISLFGVSSGEEMPQDLSKLSTPPSFTHLPNPLVTYYVVETSSNDDSATPNGVSNGHFSRKKGLACRATGYPNVTYRWLKDDVLLNFTDPMISKQITKVPAEGSFYFNSLLPTDEGFYQCLAVNENGIAVDRKVQLKKAFIDSTIMAESQRIQTVSVKFGDPWTMNCSAPRSVPPAKLYWTLVSAPQNSERRFKTINFTNVAVNDKGAIFFQHVTEDDYHKDYYFACTAENTASNQLTFSNHFNFSIDPKSTRTALDHVIPPTRQYTSPSRISAIKGESFELYCIFSGYPILTPTWLHDGKRMNLSNSRISLSTNFGKSIKIDSVTDDDKGVYECVFERAPQLNEKFTVLIESIPFWIKKPHNINSSEETDVEFHCNADGNPKPQFEFFKNGQPIEPEGDRVVVNGDRLKINKLKKGENGTGDNAVYQCKAENKNGYIWANFFLNIQAYRPFILDGPGKKEAVVGQDVTLECKVYGSPKPDVSWTQPRNFGSEGVHFEITPVDHDGFTKLRLKNIDKEKHAGVYECTFWNKYGNATASGRLTVHDATFVGNIESKNGTAGSRLELGVNYRHDSNLKAEYLWFFYDQQLLNNERIDVNGYQNHTLIIDKTMANDSGVYKFVVRTPLDEESKTARVLIKDVPSTPFNVKVKCDSDAAEVSFHYTSRLHPSSFVDSYIIQVNVDPNEPESWDVYPGVSSPSIDLTYGVGKARIHLYPYGDFTFRVLARNEVGFSAPAYPTIFENDTNGSKRCRTDAEFPEVFPPNVEVKGNTAGDLEVHWDPVPRRDWYGQNFSYFVEYRESDPYNEKPWHNYTVNDPYQTSAVITDKDTIKPYTKYQVRVWSKNEKGLNPHVSPQSKEGYSGEVAPTVPPTDFKGNAESYSSATFTWNYANRSSVTGAVKGFVIEYWYVTNKRAEPTYKEAFFDINAMTGTVYDMKPNRENFAQIRVFNGAGKSEPSKPPYMIKMPEGVPSQVQRLNAAALSDSVITVDWHEPRELNGNLTNYIVKYVLISQDETKKEKENYQNIVFFNKTVGVHSKHAEIRLKDLKAESKYLIEVVGVTSAGEGEPNWVEAETTKKNLSSPPLTPSLDKDNFIIGKDHINVTYRQGKNAGKNGDQQPPGSSFYVEYRQKDSSPNNWHRINGTDDSIFVTIKNLKPGTTYELRAVAVQGTNETRSDTYPVTTAGGSAVSSTAGWLIAIIVAIILLIIILIIVCLVVRNRGAKYPVSEKEKAQGREPMLKEERGFGEYAKPPPEPEEEKRSLTAESKHSGSEETDSMAEYGDAENGRFTEDGSFIGQYGKQPVPEKLKTNNHHSSTVV